MKANIFWLFLLIPLACKVRVSDPATSPDHPANPRAAEAPPPARSDTLKMEGISTRPGNTSGGQR